MWVISQRNWKKKWWSLLLKCFGYNSYLFFCNTTAKRHLHHHERCIPACRVALSHDPILKCVHLNACRQDHSPTSCGQARTHKTSLNYFPTQHSIFVELEWKLEWKNVIAERSLLLSLVLDLMEAASDLKLHPGRVISWTIDERESEKKTDPPILTNLQHQRSERDGK